MKRMEFELPDARESPLDHMIECGRVLTKSRLNNICSGNESLVLNDREKVDQLEMYVTRSGSKLGHLDELTAIVRTSLGEIDGNMTLASSEADIHKEVHRERLEESPSAPSSACVHGHTLHAAALSMQFEEAGKARIEIPEDYRTSRLGKSVPVFVSQYGSGASDMVENMPPILRESPGLILGNHGAFAAGEDLGEAVRFLMDLESAAEKMVSDRTSPEKLREIEGRAPDNWPEKYSIAGLDGREKHGCGESTPSTLEEMMEEREKPAEREYLEEIYEEFERIGQDLTDFSMDPYGRGSLSHRIGGTIYITGAGADFPDLEKKDVLAFGMGEGSNLEAGTCEGWLHERIYDNISTNYISHLFPEYSTRYSIHCGDSIIPIDVEGQYMTKKIPVAELEEEVLSEENVDKVIDALKFNEKVSYVRGLGGIGLGDGGLYEPLHFLESAESSVKMTVMAERIGVDVKERQKEFESW